jgi:hypothetical protein
MGQKKIEYKQRKSEDWEKTVQDLINSSMDVSFYPKDGEIFIAIKGNNFI